MAGTGTPISQLHGVALEKAVKAALGNGTVANGGAGVAGGEIVLTAVRHAPLALAGGAVVAGAGVRATLTARQFAKAVDGQIAAVTATTERVEYLRNELVARTADAIGSLDALEARPDDESLIAAFSAIEAVGEVLSTPLAELSN